MKGTPLRRPPWSFDVRTQGDGLEDIPTHLVDHAQQLVSHAQADVTQPLLSYAEAAVTQKTVNRQTVAGPGDAGRPSDGTATSSLALQSSRRGAGPPSSRARCSRG